MSSDAGVQKVVHALETGGLRTVIKAAMFAALIVALVLIYLFIHFAGLDSITAMDQGQIARNMAEGKGFTTSYIRPMAMWQLRESGRAGVEIDGAQMPDFFQSPLNPAVNVIPLLLAKGSWKIGPADYVYGPDRMLAGVSMLFFLLSVAVWYAVVRRLFDSRLASITAVLILVTDLFWRFSLSALPQMLMLFIFSLGLLASVLAFEAGGRGNKVKQLAFLFVAGLLFGLLTLAHGLAFWIFFGWLIWVAIYFKPRFISALIPLAGFFIVVAPWLVRTQVVCGNPFGLGLYSAVSNGKMEEALFNSTDPDFSKNVPLLSRIRSGIPPQIGDLVDFLGTNFVAMAFFLALMHPFRSPQAAAFRWCLLLMWVLATVGMAIFGVDGAISVNQLHVLFIPLFSCYGLAFLMVLWSRLQIGEEFLRKAFLTVIVLLTAVPLLLTVFGGPQKKIQWPPYLPPIIGVLGDWFHEDEVICSDMPWAVSWYSGRKSLLLPKTVASFVEIHDFEQLKMPVPALYLTPVSGNQHLFSGIYKGPFKEWTYFITRPPQPKGFPLQAYTGLPIEGESIIFADRERWNDRKP